MKRNINNLSTIFLMVLGISLFTCCSSFVKVEPPKSRLLSGQVFEEAGTLQAALSGLYGELRDGNNGLLFIGASSMSQYAAYAGDELVNYTTTSTTYGPNFYDNTLYADSPDLLALWNVAYTSIYYANAILIGTTHSSSLPESAKAMGRGEALFVRALLHFYLSGLFGDIPYVSGTDHQVNRVLAREPASTVLDKAVADLLEAEALLGENYPTAERIRPNKWVARALLARVYLYQGQWALAAAKANEVISHGAVYQWVDDLSKVFLKASTETIWAFKPKTEGLQSGAALLYRRTPTTVFFSLSEPFLDAFEAGDDRRQQWVGSTSNASGTYYYPYKYQFTQYDSEVNVEYLVLFRLTEQYLIRAEALAQQGRIDEAKADLDKIRHRAGLAGTAASSQEDLLDAILQERRIELFSEFGHRWFDLKRTGRADEVLRGVKPHWDATDVLFPIPEKEFLANPNLLPQNQGY